MRECTRLVYLSPGRGGALSNTIMNLRVSWQVDGVFTSWATIGFSLRTPHHIHTIFQLQQLACTASYGERTTVA